MSDNDKETKGRVPDDVIAAYVYRTAVRTAGVYEMSRKSRGVRVAYDEEAGYTIEVYMIVEFGGNIPETAWNVQKGVYEGLKLEYGVEAADINIHVQGVHAE